MNLLTAIKVAQLLKALAPLIGEVYAQMNVTFAGKPGVVKFNAFVNQIRSYVGDVEELKPFEGVLEQAIPRLKTVVTDYHQDVQKLAAPTVSAPGGAAGAAASATTTG